MKEYYFIIRKTESEYISFLDKSCHITSEISEECLKKRFQRKCLYEYCIKRPYRFVMIAKGDSIESVRKQTNEAYPKLSKITLNTKKSLGYILSNTKLKKLWNKL